MKHTASTTQNKSSKPQPKAPITCKNFATGKFVAASGPEFEIHSPYTGQKIGQARETTAKDLDRIVESAQEAQIAWALTPIKERSQIMFAFRELLKRDIKKLSAQISSECGKTLPEAEAEILKGIEVVEFALSIQNLDAGGRLEVSRGVFCEYRREALGVVAAVTPFNFPAMVPMWMIPIAITLGNAFIWKPSDKTPLTSLMIAELLNEAGLPHGIFNIAQGGKKTVELILDHPDIKAIGFVGSTFVAKEIYRRGSQNFKRVLALGGAKNHIILLPDADPSLTGKGVADSFTGCAGQRCMAASVLCTVATNTEEKKQIAKLIEAIVDYAKKITLGEKPGQMGAIISQTSLQNLEKAIARAEKDGGHILLDGRLNISGAAIANHKQKKSATATTRGAYPTDVKTRGSNPADVFAAKNLSADYHGGNWLAPTIIDNVKPGTQAATEELFGPVLSIIHCKSLKEALKIQNSSPYGNAVSVFTQNGGYADEIAKYGKAGMVGINIGVPVPREPFSFGGTYESKFGHGDITGVHSLDFWSNIKKVTTKWAVQKDWSWMG